MKLHGLLEDCGMVGHGCILGSGKWRVEKRKRAVLTGKILNSPLKMLSEVDMSIEKYLTFSRCMCQKSSAYIL